MAEKQKRKTALGNFTRTENTMKLMFDKNCPSNIVTAQFQKLSAAWEKLEEAHDNFLVSIVGDVDEDDENYLDAPLARWNAIVERYSDHVNQSVDTERTEEQELQKKNREEEEKLKQEAQEKMRKKEAKVRFDAERAEMVVCVAAFKRLVVSLTDSIVEASDWDKRRELEKLEADYSKLKSRFSKLPGIDSSQDVTDLSDQFVADVETPFASFQKKVISQLKDSSTSGGTSVSSSSSGGGASSNSKRELIKLPSFEGAESSSPYVNFPVWKKQWDIQIEDYEERHRAGLLKSHVDLDAAEKFIGHEGNYAEMMKRLEAFFGDRQKVVRHVLNEVLSPGSITEGHYEDLIMYSTTLENNFSRLSSMSLENEMSNTSIMSAIVRRFPRSVGEKWHQHLLSRSSSEQEIPFPLFISWIGMERAVWERMVSTEESAVRRADAGNYFVDNAEQPRTCYKCQKVGHVRRDCPDNKKDSNNKKVVKTLKVKKFWCALHKGDKGKKCYSNSCMELRKMTDVQKRIELLKENGDCIHCCGDHKPNDCKYEERVCGGGRTDRGCKKPHKVHELFCKDAKVFACVTVSAVEVGEQSRVEGVVLCIMVVCAPKGYSATVFWDNGATSNFIRENFAQLCGFKGTTRTLSVTTLGNVTTEYLTVIEYCCRIVDLDGVVVEFKT